MSLGASIEVERYKKFIGRNDEEMPKLIAEGRVPLSVSGLMQRKLDLRKDNVSDIDSYEERDGFDSGDAAVYHPDGRVKIVLDSQYLRKLTPKFKRVSNNVILTKKQYDSMEGEEFKKGEFGEIEKWLSREEAKVHPIWRLLARDQALLEDYVDYVFMENKENPYHNTTAMHVFINHFNGSLPEMAAWHVGGIWNGGSYVRGGSHFGSNLGLFVGEMPEINN